MVAALLLSFGLLGAGDREAYAAAKAQAGRDPDAHVKLALWCEQHGMTAQRAKHLALAVLLDPKHAMARGLMGFVRDREAWRRPEDVTAQLQADAARAAQRAEYDAKRQRAPHTADGQWKLALWCEEQGLKAEARAHLTAVVRLDPGREAAWKRLGFKKHGKRWVTEVQLAAEKQERSLQEKADRQWKPLLEKWRSWLDEKDKRRVHAEDALAGITDPRAVPMVLVVFGAGGPQRQSTAVRVLGQIDSVGSSRALAMFAVFGKSAEIRRVATETLRRRDVREFADLLIALVRDPIKYEVRSVKGPGSQGELFVHGKKVNYKRLYSPPAMPNLPLPDGPVSFDANGLPVLSYTGAVFGETGNRTPAEWFAYASSIRVPVSPALGGTLTHVFQNLGAGAHSQQISTAMISTFSGEMNAAAQYQLMSQLNSYMIPSMMSITPNPTTMFNLYIGERYLVPIGEMAVEAQKSALGAQQQLENDVRTLKALNIAIDECNSLVVPILVLVSGQDFGPDREAWEKWLLDQIGFRKLAQQASDTTTIVENVPLAYQPAPIPIGEVTGVVGFSRASCFGRGTAVRTVGGLKPIEALLPGDLVLAQNLQTGALRYRPILAVHHNPPGKTFRVELGGETIVSSEFHRFWKAGRGWVMARDLKPGDALRTLGGIEAVSSIDEGKVEPVYNLDVADDADFFVGRRGALVHDNTLPDLRLAPFDAATSVTARPVGATNR